MGKISIILTEKEIQLQKINLLDDNFILITKMVIIMKKRNKFAVRFIYKEI